MRFEKPSQIQAETIPRIIDGKDLIAQAQSGAGKTVAFSVGMLSRIDPTKAFPQALCLTPTRELAIQIVRDAVVPLSKRFEIIKVASAIAGSDPARGEVCDSQIVVGTPGTVKRWLSMQYLKPKNINIFVVDEADTMVGNSQKSRSLGAETIFIKKQLRPDCQILLFSATYSEEVMSFAKTIMKPNVTVIRPPSVEDLMLDVIFQVRMDVRKHRGGKLGILKDIYDFMTIEQSIVFVERRDTANQVAESLKRDGLEVSVLHSELEREMRDHVMEDFRRGDSKVLITTNVLARGVDVPSVAVVVNYDIPIERVEGVTVADTANYLHRIGRCGRFGRLGTAINFISSESDERLMIQIEKFYRPKQRITTEWDPNDIEGLKEAISHRGKTSHDEAAAVAVEPISEEPTEDSTPVSPAPLEDVASPEA
jgi:ATP-dependent RNA helicase DDX19/DBP5